MAAQTLASGLAGAIGCDYRQVGNRLVFVEYGGYISELLLNPHAAVVSSGTALLHGTWLFDFDAGVEVALNGTGDVWWEQMTSTARQLVPSGGAGLVNLGVVSFGGIGYAQLQGLPYASTPIPGSVGAGNQLGNGDVFAVRTNNGNLAKVKVVSYGYDLKIQWVTYKPPSGYVRLGTGYGNLEDIVVSADETTAWVSERSGQIYRVDLTSANASSGTTAVLVSGLVAPQQLAVDEAARLAYVVEYDPAGGRLIRIDLTTNAWSVVSSGLMGAVGLALDSATGTAYVTEQQAGGGQLTRVRLSDGRHDTVATGLGPVFMLTWADEVHSALYTTQRDPVNAVLVIGVGAGDVRTVESATAWRPNSVAMAGPAVMLLACENEIDRYDLSPYVASGPVLLGIGHIPADKVVGGLATTDPSYFFPVTQAPFGGTLPIMVNHLQARSVGAKYYSVEVDGLPVVTPFADYKWVAGAFTLTTTTPSAVKYFPVRSAADLWYNAHLGYFAATGGLPDGMHRIAIRLFSAANPGSELGAATDAGRFVDVMVHNHAPRAIIETVAKDGLPVGPCALVHTSGAGTGGFTFTITADSPDGYLSSWALWSQWGSGGYALIASDSYAAHAPALWTGVTSSTLPPGGWDANAPGDPSSVNCAHGFTLQAWDRTTDGWSQLYVSTTSFFLTILP